MWENILELAFHLLPHRQGSKPHDIWAVELVQRPPCPGTLLPLCDMCHHHSEANDSHQGLWANRAVLAPGPTPHPSVHAASRLKFGRIFPFACPEGTDPPAMWCPRICCRP